MNYRTYLANIESDFLGDWPQGFCFVWGISANKGEEYSLCVECAAKRMAEDAAQWEYLSDYSGYRRADNKTDDESVAISSNACQGSVYDEHCKSCGKVVCEGRHFALDRFDNVQTFSIRGHPELGEDVFLCIACVKGMFDDEARFGLYGGIHYKGNTLWTDAEDVATFTSEETATERLVCANR